MKDESEMSFSLAMDLDTLGWGEDMISKGARLLISVLVNTFQRPLQGKHFMWKFAYRI